MWATASPLTDEPVRRDLYYPWLALAVVCTWLMWMSPGNETIQAAIDADAYGLGDWELVASGAAQTGGGRAAARCPGWQHMDLTTVGHGVDPPPR